MHPRNDPGVPLAAYLRDDPRVTVLFICNGCQAWHEVPIPKVVERLKARGLGSEQTGIREVGRFAERPCRKCGALDFQTRPGFQPGPARMA